MQFVDLVPELAPVILAARQQRDARNTLARYLPNTPVRSISYRLGRARRLDQTVPVRANDAPATPIARPGVIDLQGDLPNITPIDYLTEDDLELAQRLANVNVDLGLSVAQCARNVALAVDNTFEVMRGQLLSTGIVTLQLEDGNVRQVDFAIPGAQKIAVPVAWTDGAYADDPFEELEAAHAVYQDAQGADAGVMVTSRRTVSVLGTFLRNKYPQQPIGAATVTGELAMRNLPPIEVNDRTLTTADGTRTRVFPEGTITFLPSSDTPVGRTELGITQEAVQQVQNRILTPDLAPGLTIVTLGQDNPIQRAVKGAAKGLPVLADTDAIVIMSGVLG